MVSTYILAYIFKKDPRSLEIVRYVMENKVCTIHEISRALSIPYGAVYSRVKKLERMRVLSVEYGPRHSKIVSIAGLSRKIVENAIAIATEAKVKKRRR